MEFKKALSKQLKETNSSHQDNVERGLAILENSIDHYFMGKKVNNIETSSTKDITAMDNLMKASREFVLVNNININSIEYIKHPETETSYLAHPIGITITKHSQSVKDLECTSKQVELPYKEEFKKEAWELKTKQGIKITEALNILAKKYGYKNYNAIKSLLKETPVWNPTKQSKPKLLTHF